MDNRYEPPTQAKEVEHKWVTTEVGNPPVCSDCGQWNDGRVRDFMCRGPRDEVVVVKSAMRSRGERMRDTPDLLGVFEWANRITNSNANPTKLPAAGYLYILCTAHSVIKGVTGAVSYRGLLAHEKVLRDLLLSMYTRNIHDIGNVAALADNMIYPHFYLTVKGRTLPYLEARELLRAIAKRKSK